MLFSGNRLMLVPFLVMPKMPPIIVTTMVMVYLTHVDDPFFNDLGLRFGSFFGSNCCT
jgi:hypothetical protein